MDVIHLPPPTLGALTLHWTEATGLPIRGVVRTCSSCCRDGIAYEYGVIGGAYRVRRTNHRTGRADETPAVPRPQAERWWHEVLAGRAI